ncbi:MAG TPA: monooxygenase [Polyangiales bacterium]|nr:monooxygenase [Polyangiales bacterium]
MIASCTSSHDMDGKRREERQPSSDKSDEVKESEDDLGEPLSYYADVKPIIDAKCTACHVEGGIGPLPLTSYDEVAQVKDLVAHDVKIGKMPPWRANAAMDFYVSERRLTADQKDKIVRWVKQGAPEGDPEDEPEPEPAPPRGLTRVDGTLKFARPYTPKVNDEYRCIVLKWPYTETKYVTGLSVEPDRREMVHHGVLYFVRPDGAEAVLKRDAESEEEGYPCTGVTGGGGAWLTSYEPGGYGQDIPGGLGFEIPPGSLFVLQMHYTTLNGAFPDQSRLDYTVEDHVDRVGRVSLLMNPLWLAGFMPIPAGEPDVVHAAAMTPVTASASGPSEVYWADLHMHQLGKSGSIGIVRANGERVGLLDIPSWAFEWQETYVLRKPVRLNAGDRMYVECHYDNSAEHQPLIDGQRAEPRDVNWGDHTSDEMCLGAVLIGPPR